MKECNSQIHMFNIDISMLLHEHPERVNVITLLCVCEKEMRNVCAQLNIGLKSINNEYSQCEQRDKYE